MMLRILAALALLLLPAAVRAEWWEARTDNFIVYSETSAADARRFSEKLQRFEMALRSLQNIKYSPETSDSMRLTVFRTGQINDIGRLAGSQGVAGFYIPRAGGPVAFTPARREIGEKGAANADRRADLDPQTVLFHEYSHHFMYRHFSAAYPAWYREGFAEAYSTIDLKDDGSFHLGNAPQARSAAFSGLLNFSVQRMLQSANRPGFEDVYGRYSHGWLLTHYLTFEPSRQGQLQNYLQLINAGTEPTDAAQQAFGDLRKLESEIKRYLNGDLPGALVRPAGYRTPTVALRRLGPDEEAIMNVRMRSKVGVTRKKAKDVAADARAVAANHPQSFPVQLALTEAEFDAENLDLAERAADAALALRPNAVEALIFKGRIYLERGKSDRRQNATARSWFAKAHKADPTHPSVLHLNYLTYFQAGGAIPEPAIIGLEQAFTQAPYDSDLRLTVALQLLAEKDGQVARRVLAPLVHSPHESKSAKALRQVFDLLAANKVDDAYSALVAEIAKQEEERKAGKERD
ncbi:MAG TPA: hypothetical protein VMN38_05695 [Sphingomicrobium sp.]|nr:hypothetical protein [Sphingomicrobium sp.]